ncbi:dihydrofolate reductase FolA [Legionella birminghamensis]|uniref:Dihydrofolate reductase n=1 Tax=Legionella birminghamensis TaxID=28083 RepID=A0A378IE88_9GAMM|nr:dihydrofolate reductase [Legionella birminghamensis]KTC75295.1 dihydrofolate reductase FolA [Legionella birminghamensis]STX33062.1 dihydrofolate reductase [Legionella birminghamensis]
MSKISLIAAVDENNGLGKDNQLLCHLPADLKFFKQTTLGKPIIMGRKTFTSIGKALPGRQNIVISRSMTPVQDIDIAHSLEDALSIAQAAEEVMIIGGASLYQQILPQAERIYLTRIHHRFAADVFFPAINPEEWSCELIGEHEKDEKNPYSMSFYLYSRKA